MSSPSPDETELSLAKKNLKQVPDFVRSLIQLKKIDCAFNSELDELPDWLSDLKHLEICFFLSCGFTKVPMQLTSMNSLRMLSLKSCQLSGQLPCSRLPNTVEWLILTGNRLDSISDDVAEALPRLRKVMLSHNNLEAFPSGMSKLRNLELLRIAGNRFKTVPVDFIATAAQNGLKWLAMAGNPCSVSPQLGSSTLPIVTLEDLAVDVNSTPLGKGASGVVYSGIFQGQAVAVKLFSVGEAAIKSLSDGRPEDEIAACACACDSNARGLIGVRALLSHQTDREPAGGGSRVSGVVFDVYSEAHGWFSLGNPPSQTSTTRDAYTPPQVARLQDGGAGAALVRALRTCCSVAAAVEQLHLRGFVHGDVYAHNTLVRGADGEAVLVDLGAAFFVGRGASDADAAAMAAARAPCFRMDTAALAALVEEVLSLAALPPAEFTGALALDELRAVHSAPAIAAADAALVGPESVARVVARVHACADAAAVRAFLQSLASSHL